jgi:hypothetical protein
MPSVRCYLPITSPLRSLSIFTPIFGCHREYSYISTPRKIRSRAFFILILRSRLKSTRKTTCLRGSNSACVYRIFQTKRSQEVKAASIQTCCKSANTGEAAKTTALQARTSRIIPINCLIGEHTRTTRQERHSIAQAQCWTSILWICHSRIAVFRFPSSRVEYTLKSNIRATRESTHNSAASTHTTVIKRDTTRTQGRKPPQHKLQKHPRSAEYDESVGRRKSNIMTKDGDAISPLLRALRAHKVSAKVMDCDQ